MPGTKSADASISGELRYVATLMADVASSTEITESLGSEKSFLLLQEIVSLCWSQIQTMQGHPLNFTGDGVFAVFGAPVAVERASLMACRAAVEIVARLKEESPRLQADYGILPNLRIGIASGEVLVTAVDLGGRMSISAVGSAVNLASRLQGLAEVGQVLCSDQVVADLGDDGAFADLGSRALKGYSEEQNVFALTQLLSSTPAGGRNIAAAETAFVGRSTELSQLRTWVETTSVPAAMSIEGVAGIGKSRIIGELFREMPPGVRPVLGACTTETIRRPLHALVEILRHYIGWTVNFSFETTKAALAGVMDPLLDNPDQLVGLVQGRQGASSGSVADEAYSLRTQIISAILSLGKRSDVLLVIEDAHWIDPLSKSVIKELLRLETTGFHLLMTRRPSPEADWLPKDQSVTLRLNALTRKDIAEIAQFTLSEGRESTFIDFVAEKSEGNPFFATEMLRHFEGQVEGSLKASGIGTIQNLVFARFDPLDEDSKDVLRFASAIGRSFSLDLLHRVTGRPHAELHQVFARSEGLVEVGTTDGVLTGQFSHVLWRETIHGSLPSAKRIAIHRLIGEMIEETHRSNLSEVAEALIYHFEISGDQAKSVAYLGLSAHNAYRLYALETCDQQFDRAFALIGRNPDLVTDQAFGELLQFWVTCLDLKSDFAKIKRVLAVHLSRLEQKSAGSHFSECLALLSIAHCHAGGFHHGLDLVNKAIAAGESVQDPKAIARAKVAKIRILADSGFGTTEEIQQLFDETREFAESLVNMHTSFTRLYHLIAFFRSRGMIAKAMHYSDVLFDLADRTGDRQTKIIAYWSRCVLRIIANDFENSLLDSQNSLRLSIPGTGHWMVAHTAIHSANMRAGKDVDLSVFSTAIISCEQVEDLTLRNANVANSTLWYFRQGKIAKGWRYLNYADRVIADSGTAEAKMHVKLMRQEVLLAVSGLSLRKGPKRKLAAVDIAQALVLRVGAKQKIKKISAEILAQKDVMGGLFVGKCYTALGLVARAEKQTAAANAYFDQAVAGYESEQMHTEANEVHQIAKA